MNPPTGQPVFFYDLGHPACYLVAEQIVGAFAVVPEWEPVVGSALSGGAGAAVDILDRAVLEARAAQLCLQPLRWPPRVPGDSREAMLAATYAKRVGRAVAFSLAAFRQAFAGGRDLGAQETVLIAAAACEMHPAAIVKAIALRSVAEALEQANIRAAAAGVSELPAIEVGGRVFTGLDAVEQVAAMLEAAG